MNKRPYLKNLSLVLLELTYYWFDLIAFLKSCIGICENNQSCFECLQCFYINFENREQRINKIDLIIKVGNRFFF